MRGATTGGDHSTSGGELRRNPVNGKLTIVAPGRAARPSDLHAAAVAGASDPCPFCAGNERLTPPEVDAVRPDGGAPDTPGWRIRVVPNKYPALAGMHEVIVHSPDHEAELEDLGDDGLLEVLEVWRRRIAAQLDAGAVAATLIVNRGPGAGASLAHPHAQLNLWLHTAPKELRGTFHWHLELAPRLASIAGLELGADIALVTVDPKTAAKALRAAWPQD